MAESISSRLQRLMELAMSDLAHEEFLEKFKQLLQEARREERVRACRLILEYDVYTPYITEKIFVSERKDKIIELIMDGWE